MKSSVDITTARVFAIAGPAMLANLTTPLIGIVATSAVGRLGTAALLGGVAMASIAFDCLFWLFSFLRLGTVAFTAQALGAGHEKEVRAVLARALIMSAAIGLVLLALQRPLAALIFDLMGGSDAVRSVARLYFFIRMWSTPFALANYALLGWFVGQAKVRTALAIQIAVNLINITATVMLVTVFDRGVAGAALAAVIAEAAGCLIGLLAVSALGGLDLKGVVVFDRHKVLRLMSVNRDIMIRTASLIAAFLFFTSQGARAGEITLAANAVLNNFILIGSFFLDGLANAAEQLCGQSFGARDAAGFGRTTRLVSGWAFGFGLALTVIFLFAGRGLIDVMAVNADVRSTACDYLPFAALAPVCAVMAYCFDGIYIGATWARDMRNLMIAAFATYLVAWYFLQDLGNRGLWIALLVFLVSRGLYQAVRFPELARRSFSAANAEQTS